MGKLGTKLCGQQEGKTVRLFRALGFDLGEDRGQAETMSDFKFSADGYKLEIWLIFQDSALRCCALSRSALFLFVFSHSVAGAGSHTICFRRFRRLDVCQICPHEWRLFWPFSLHFRCRNICIRVLRWVTSMLSMRERALDRRLGSVCTRKTVICWTTVAI